MLFVFLLLYCDDSVLEHNPAGTLCGLMPTDSTEDGGFHRAVEEGFTQVWDTAGAGTN
jgi:hypothetical protein